jgi:hypothetical protein
VLCAPNPPTYVTGEGDSEVAALEDLAAKLDVAGDTIR